jgi:hypothetical protein
VMVATGTPPERVMGSDALPIEDIQTPADKGFKSSNEIRRLLKCTLDGEEPPGFV